MIRCPKCRAEIAVADLNMQEGVGLCRACQTLTRLGELAEDPQLAAVDTAKPPDGCVVRDLGEETVVTASARSVGRALGMLAVCAFWNGIVSIFVLFALAGTIRYLTGSIPDWFPAPKDDRGHGLGDTLGMLIFFWLFLTPFILIGLAILGTLLMNIAGRVEVRLRGADGVVRTGVGPICWTRRFDAATVRSVGLGQTRWQQNNQNMPLIEIKTEQRNIRFGTQLPDERRAWLAAVCRELLVDVADTPSSPR